MNATATYLQRGEALDYINKETETIPAGVVLAIGDRIGVTGTDIRPGELGSVHMVGVFEIPKAESAAIAMGTTVYFNGTGITTQASTTSGEGDNATTAANVKAGYAAADSAATDPAVLVQIGA